VSDNDLSWYVSISPINRYLFSHILRSFGFTISIIVVIQFLPVAVYLKDFTFEVGGLILIVRGVVLAMKLFRSFPSILFVLDKNGATVMQDQKARGFRYVAKEVSTMRWDTLGARINEPKTPTMNWGQVLDVTEETGRHVILLTDKMGGTLRLFCREDNYDEVLEYVNQRVNVLR